MILRRSRSLPLTRRPISAVLKARKSPSSDCSGTMEYDRSGKRATIRPQAVEDAGSRWSGRSTSTWIRAELIETFGSAASRPETIPIWDITETTVPPAAQPALRSFPPWPPSVRGNNRPAFSAGFQRRLSRSGGISSRRRVIPTTEAKAKKSTVAVIVFDLVIQAPDQGPVVESGRISRRPKLNPRKTSRRMGRNGMPRIAEDNRQDPAESLTMTIQDKQDAFEYRINQPPQRPERPEQDAAFLLSPNPAETPSPGPAAFRRPGRTA